MTLWNSDNANPSNPNSVWSDEDKYRGAAGTITIGSVQTGSDSSIENVGTSQDAILNFVLEKGDKGDKPDHVWSGTQLSFELNDGTYGDSVNLKGDTGEQGPRGLTGLTGKAATVTVGSTSTGEPGTNVVVENVGTTHAAVFNFTVPKGSVGPQGIPGDVQTLVAGQNIQIDDTDSANPIVKTTDDITANNLYSASLVGGIWGALNKIHVQNYSPGLGYLTQNLKRNGDMSWSLDWNVDYGVGVGLDSSNTATNPGINFMGCATGYSGSQPTKALMTPDGKWGFLTTSPTATIDNAGSTRLRGHVYDSTNSKGSLNNIATRGTNGLIWSAPNDAGKYACTVWKTGDAVNPVTGTIGSYNAVWQNDGQLNVTSGVYTVPVTGLYRVAFSAFKHNNNAGTEVRLFKNGVATGVRGYAGAYQGNTGAASAGTAHIHFVDGSTQYVQLGFEALGNFNAGDTLDVRVTAGGVHGNESCYLTIYKAR